MDATQALLIVIITFAVRDGLLGWALIKWVIRVSTPAVPVVPVPLPGTPADPGVPPVIVTPPTPPVPPAVPLQSGKGSWYSQYQGKYSWVDDGDAPGSNALGVPDDDQGVSFLDRATLGKWFEVHAPNGVVSIERQTDIGPATSTGRSIDISAAAAEKRFGYSPQNFPTDGIFQWRPATAPGTTTPTTGTATGVTPSWLTLARSLIGVNENDDPSRIVGWSKAIAAKFPDMASYSAQYTSADIAWCGQFVAYVLSQSGIRPVFGPTDTDKYLWAFAWKTWGTDASNDPQPGDVLVFKWSNGGGHVTFYDHEVDDNSYHCTGGNQGSPGQVSTEAMSMSACVAIRRPPSV